MLEEVRVQRLAEARAAGDDECAYLLASPANGRRLLGAIESLESGGGTIQNVDFE